MSAMALPQKNKTLHVQCLGTKEDAFLRMRVAEQRQLRINEFF